MSVRLYTRAAEQERGELEGVAELVRSAREDLEAMSAWPRNAQTSCNVRCAPYEPMLSCPGMA